MQLCLSDFEVTLGVVEGDILHHLAQCCLVGGVLTVIDPAADQLAQNAAEVLVTGVAQEGARVGEHADEVAQQAQACQNSHLIDHAVLGIIEPPGRAMLDLAGNLGALEAAQDGAQLSIVGGVQGVQDGAGQLLLAVELAQQLVELLAAVGDGDSVEAGIGAQLAEHLVVVVAQA